MGSRRLSRNVGPVLDVCCLDEQLTGTVLSRFLLNNNCCCLLMNKVVNSSVGPVKQTDRHS